MTSSSSAGPVPEPGPEGGLKTTVPGTGVLNRHRGPEPDPHCWNPAFGS